MRYSYLMILIEVLYFEGCPNAALALELAERVVREEGSEAEIRSVLVDSNDHAERLHFLGSPSIRVDGRDVQPGADSHDSYQLSCRVYDRGGIMSGEPDPEWIREALRASR